MTVSLHKSYVPVEGTPSDALPAVPWTVGVTRIATILPTDTREEWVDRLVDSCRLIRAVNIGHGFQNAA